MPSHSARSEAQSLQSTQRILICRRMDSATSRGMTADIFVALKWKSNYMG